MLETCKAFGVIAGISMCLGSAYAQPNSTAQHIQQTMISCLEIAQNVDVNTADQARENCQGVLDIFETIGPDAVQDPFFQLAIGVANVTRVRAERVQTSAEISQAQCDSLRNGHYAFYGLRYAANIDNDPTHVGAALNPEKVGKAQQLYAHAAPFIAELDAQKASCVRLTQNDKWPSN